MLNSAFLFLVIVIGETWISVPSSIGRRIEKNEILTILQVRQSFVWGANVQGVWESYLSDYAPLVVLDIDWRFNNQRQLRVHSFRVRFRTAHDRFIRVGTKGPG